MVADLFRVAKHTFSYLDYQIIYKTITWNKKQTIIYLKSTNCLKSFLSLLDSIKSLEPLVNDLFLFVESDIMNRWKIWAKIMVELSEWWQYTISSSMSLIWKGFVMIQSLYLQILHELKVIFTKEQSNVNRVNVNL